MDSIIRHHKSQKQNKNYFTQETENAIVLYNTTINPILKSKIYEDKIHYPFYKLTENIIHTFKFYYTEVENLEDLQHEIITFLLEKIHLFDPSKGAKAYSYFGTIVKRWLIIYNEKNYKKQVNNIAVNNLNNYSNLDTTDPAFIISQKVNKEIDTLLEEEDMYDNVEPETQGFKYDDRLSHFIDLYVNYCTKNIFNIFPKEYDAQIADAILELFRKRDNINIFNKKALYIYIREMIDVKTPKITKIATQLYDIFKEKYSYYLEHGNFPS